MHSDPINTHTEQNEEPTYNMLIILTSMGSRMQVKPLILLEPSPGSEKATYP